MSVPPLYPIVDVATLAAVKAGLREFAEGLRAAGVGLVQLRYKDGSPAQVLSAAQALREALPNALLIMNDRADLAVLAGFDGVHVGQGDLAVGDARSVGAGPTHRERQRRDEWGTGKFTDEFVVGLSTHTEEQVRTADAGDADYVAIGPVFATGTKADAAPVVGLEGVRRARALTRKPLVAIGGITRENCRGVMDAGADSVAVISGLLALDETVERVARDFLRLLA
jgi:thiamine-phosphate pyrophosphorylase